MLGIIVDNILKSAEGKDFLLVHVGPRMAAEIHVSLPVFSCGRLQPLLGIYLHMYIRKCTHAMTDVKIQRHQVFLLLDSGRFGCQPSCVTLYLPPSDLDPRPGARSGRVSLYLSLRRRRKLHAEMRGGSNLSQTGSAVSTLRTLPSAAGSIVLPGAV